MKNSANELFSKEELKQITERHNLPSATALIACWAVIIAMFTMVYYWPNVLTILLALIIIGGRQLALAITMHECAHRTFFTSSKWNDRIGQWFASWPILQDVHLYREHHLRHHRHNGTEQDPDLHLARGFPISEQKFLRNLGRDLSGIVGYKAVIGSLLMLAGIINYNVSSYGGIADRSEKTAGQKWTESLQGVSGALLSNLTIFLVCVAIGSGWLYLLWIASFMTTYMMLLRWRATAEHGLTDEPDNALRNSRTTYANWLARITLAPLNVNYHLEHHMLVAIPWHRLPLAHQILQENGLFADNSAKVSLGYKQIYLEMTRQPPQKNNL